MSWCCNCDGYPDPGHEVVSRSKFKVTWTSNKKICIFCGYHAVWMPEVTEKIDYHETRKKIEKAKENLRRSQQDYVKRIEAARKARRKKVRDVIEPLVLAGMTIREMVEATGKSNKTVYRWVRMFPDLKKHNKIVVVKKALALKDAGMTSKEISKEMCVTQRTVFRYFEEARELADQGLL